MDGALPISARAGRDVRAVADVHRLRSGRRRSSRGRRDSLRALGHSPLMTAGESGRLEPLIKAQAYGLGFDLCGIATLAPPESRGHFEEWIARGYAGDMSYLARGAEKRCDPTLVFPPATS